MKKALDILSGNSKFGTDSHEKPECTIKRRCRQSKKQVLSIFGLVFLLITPHKLIAQNELFIGNFSGGTITRMNLDGSGATVIVTGLTLPEDGTCGGDGTLYFAESMPGRIRKFNRTGGGLSTILSSPTLMPEGLSFDASGNLFFNTRSASNGAVWEMIGASGPPMQATAVYTGFGEGTVFKANGNLLAVARAEGRIWEFTPPFYSMNPGTIFASGLVMPFGIAISSCGQVFVADRGTGTIEKFSSTGTPLGTFASGISLPHFIEFDASDNLYVAASGPIYKITPDGTKTIIATVSDAIGLAICSARKINLDIKPQSCPNPLNPKSRGVLPVAILGGPGFDVSEIDVSTVQLIGVPPLRSDIEDVASPVTDRQECCDCTTEGPDGFLDLTLKFDRQEILDALGEVHGGEEHILSITGNLEDGTSIEGKDCIVIPPVGKVPQPVVVGSIAPVTFALFQNSPNPFSASGGSSVISYHLPVPSYTSLKVFDITGKFVETLVDEFQEPGIYQLPITSYQLPGSGIYFYRLTAGDFVATRKAVLLR